MNQATTDNALKVLETAMQQMRDKIAELEAENERLKREVARLEGISKTRESVAVIYSGQAKAWEAVTDVLNNLVPGWGRGPGLGIDLATTAIRNLAKERDDLRHQLDSGTELQREELSAATVASTVYGKLDEWRKEMSNLREENARLKQPAGNEGLATKVTDEIVLVLKDHNIIVTGILHHDIRNAVAPYVRPVRPAPLEQTVEAKCERLKQPLIDRQAVLDFVAAKLQKADALYRNEIKRGNSCIAVVEIVDILLPLIGTRPPLSDEMAKAIVEEAMDKEGRYITTESMMFVLRAILPYTKIPEPLKPVERLTIGDAMVIYRRAQGSFVNGIKAVLDAAHARFDAQQGKEGGECGKS